MPRLIRLIIRRVYPEDLYRSVVVEDPVYGTLDMTERDTSL